jgi:DNA-binding MarR family transcriptional regulator
VSDLKLDAYLPYRLSVAANAVSELIARAYQSRFGLTIPQWRLIAVLAEDGPLTQQALCARTVMDKVTVSRAAAALNERALTARAPNAADGRSHRLSLTPEGAALYAEVAPLALAYEVQLLDAFSPSERHAAHELLRRLQAAARVLASSTR